MGGVVRIVVQDHAVDQYIARHAPAATLGQARWFLAQAMATATRLRRRTYRGDPMWNLGNGVIAVAKDEGPARVVVTVLPAGTLGVADVFAHVPSDEAELLREAAAQGPSLLERVEERERAVAAGEYMPAPAPKRRKRGRR